MSYMTCIRLLEKTNKEGRRITSINLTFYAKFLIEI